MPTDEEMRRLKELAGSYKALSFEEEKAGKGDRWREEYWQLVDSLVDAGLECPLKDDHLLDPDFLSEKYEAFVHQYLITHDGFYRRSYKLTEFLRKFLQRWQRPCRGKDDPTPS